MAQILDGKKTRETLGEELKKRIASLGKVPKLAILLVGERQESKTYVNQKKKFGESIGAEVEIINFPDAVSAEELKKKIKELNDDSHYHGIIVQMPLPSHINPYELTDLIHPYKDVDGLTAGNIKKLWDGDSTGHAPATAKGILTLLKTYGVTLSGKKVVIIGRSILVGKPLALLMLHENATVTICHSATSKLEEETKKADIIVVAVGKAGLLNSSHVESHQIIIDVGINPQISKDENNQTSVKLVGDVSFDEVSKIVTAISPVPGGVGPMTVYTLFENLLNGFNLLEKNR